MNTFTMKAVLAFAATATIFLSFPVQEAFAAYPQTQISDAFYVKKDIKVLPEKDPHIEIMKAFLASRNSPMTDNAADFIEAAKKYDVDWSLS